MKTTIDTKLFRDALNKACAMKINKQLPVIAYAKLSASNGKAILTTTDLEKAIEVEVETKGGDEFIALIPQRKMQTFLTGKNGVTAIDLDNKGLVSVDRDGIGNMSFKPYSVADFPPIPVPSPDIKWAEIDAKWFCRMLGIVLTACAKEFSRPVFLTGVFFNDGAMASADGYRLVEVNHDKLALGLGDRQVIIPFQSLEIVKRLFTKVDAISVGFDIDRAYFKADGIMLTTQLIQDNYPNYNQLIPDKYYSRVSFSAPLMMQRLNMIDPNAIPSGIIRLQFQKTELGEPECALTCGMKDEDFAEYYSMRLPVNMKTQEDSKIAFKLKYLCDTVRPFSVCNLELTSPSSPGKFTGDIEGLTIVVMPMFIQW